VLNQLAASFSAKPDEVPQRISDLRDRLATAEQTVKQLKAREQAAMAGNLGNDATQIGDLSVLASIIPADTPNDLRATAAKVFQQLPNALLVAAADINGKVTLLCMASPAAIAVGHRAGDIVRALTTQLGGKGGGKPDFAMGGASDTANLQSVMNNWLQSIKES
jgi:alanyl-tRNA synthetase